MQLFRFSIPFALSSLLATAAFSQTELERLESRFEPDREIVSQPGTVLPTIDPVAAPPQASGIRFILREVLIEGNSSVVEQQIRAAYIDLIDTEVSIAEVFNLANEITSIYGDLGYPLSRAIIPAQEIDARGILRVAVVEGFANNVTIAGPA